MLFRTHIIFGLTVWLILNYVIDMPFFVLAFVLFGVAFVDIDEKTSKFGKKWFFRPIQWISKHRGFFHSLVACLLISVLIAALNKWVGFGFFVGYVSHLFLDCWTKSGIQLFWPLKFKIKGFVKSGGVTEDVIFVLLLLGNILVVGKLLFDYLF